MGQIGVEARVRRKNQRARETLSPANLGPLVDASPNPADEADGSTIIAQGRFVEFSFIRDGWTKTKPFFSWFVPPARRCSTFVVPTTEGRFIAVRCAGVRGKPLPVAGAMPGTNKAKMDGATIGIEIVIIEDERRIASSQA